MAMFDDHCNDCKRLLDSPHGKVHEFLDQHAKIFDVGTFVEYHRSFLHNRRGIEACMMMFGAEAKQAAIIHIVRDYMEMPLTGKDLKWVNSKLGKALLYFNNMDNFEPRLNPVIMKAWKGKSLCSLAFGEKKKG